jgi:hypothetical protein
MSKRIKYEYYEFEEVNGKLIPIKAMSRNSYKVDGINLDIDLNLKDYTFEILAEDGTIIVKGGNSKKKNHEVLKRQAKKALMDLGVNFKLENRKPRS